MAPDEETLDSDSAASQQQPQNNSSHSICLLEDEKDCAERKTELFSQKMEIMLLKELQKYRKNFGKKIKWKRFRKMSKLPEKYTTKHISKNFHRLKKNYKRSLSHPPPPEDHREALIFKLSKSLWKKNVAAAAKKNIVPLQNPENFARLSKLFGDISMPQLLRRHWVVIGEENALKYEQQLTKLRQKEIDLFIENLTLKEEICANLLEIFTGVQSSSEPTVYDLHDKVNLDDDDVEMLDPDVQLLDKNAQFLESKRKKIEERTRLMIDRSTIPKELRVVYCYCDSIRGCGGNITMTLDEALFGHECIIYVNFEECEPFYNLQPISYTCIVVYIWSLFRNMKMLDRVDKFRFVDPANIGHISSTKNDEKSINERMERRARELAGRLLGTLPNQTVLVPCNVGAHWILTVIDPHNEEIGILDPFYHNIDGVWKQVVDMALKMFNAEKRRKEKKIPSWSTIKVPKQPDAVQCGYYVMKYMREIVEFDAFETISSLQYLFNKESYSSVDIDEVRTEWANCVQDYIS